MEPPPGRPVDLPVELEHKIFTTFARAQQPASLVPLLSVAKRVNQWVIPEVFRAAIITNDEGCSWSRNYPPVYPTSSAPNEAPSRINPRFLRHAQHVRIALFEDTPARQIIQVLDVCPNIKNLAVWGILKSKRASETLAAKDAIRAFFPRLERFAGYSTVPVIPQYPVVERSDGRFYFTGFDVSGFSQITHLDFKHGRQDTYHPVFKWEAWKGLAQLPNLTHLTITWQLSIGSMRSILENCRALVRLTIDNEPYQATGDGTRVHDPRVVQHTKGAWSYTDEWETQTRMDAES